MNKNYQFLVALLFSTVSFFAQNLTPLIYQVDNACYGECVTLRVIYPEIKATSSYAVSSIPYVPPFSTTNGSATSLTMDDRWSGVINLKGLTPQDFNFCFYDQKYSDALISTNGTLTFSIAGVTPGGLYTPNSGSTWVASGTIPYSGPSSTAPFKNSINGVFQDTNPEVSNSFANPNINYYTIGVFPNRAFVLNFADVAQYGCSSDAAVGAQTYQIVLYETSNVIEVYVQRRVPCTSWAGGNGVIGIQNQDGTDGIAAPGRNTGSWSASYEAWRFSPNGTTVVPTITWYKDGNILGAGDMVTVCPTVEETYTAEVSYLNCTSTAGISDSFTYTPSPQINAGQPNDLSVCDPASLPHTFDLTQNDLALMMGVANPGDHVISYHTTLSGAENYADVIANPEAFASLGQIIYARIESFTTACYEVKDFELLIGYTPTVPTGDVNQTFVAGETLADLEVFGSDIRWYDAEVGGMLLPNATVLVDGVTYYASQVTSEGCESAARLGVTVTASLGVNSWSDKAFKVYPNPVKDVLNISDASKLTSVEVYTLLGQKVTPKAINLNLGQIDVSNLKTGHYIVKIISDGLTKSIKIIKD